MKVNRELLEMLYLEEIDRISDDLPEKSSFTVHEIITIIANIIDKNDIYE